MDYLPQPVAYESSATTHSRRQQDAFKLSSSLWGKKKKKKSLSLYFPPSQPQSVPAGNFPCMLWSPASQTGLEIFSCPSHASFIGHTVTPSPHFFMQAWMGLVCNLEYQPSHLDFKIFSEAFLGALLFQFLPFASPNPTGQKRKSLGTHKLPLRRPQLLELQSRWHTCDSGSNDTEQDPESCCPPDTLHYLWQDFKSQSPLSPRYLEKDKPGQPRMLMPGCISALAEYAYERG